MVTTVELKKFLSAELRTPYDDPVNQCGRLTANAEFVVQDDFGLDFERTQITLSNETGQVEHLILLIPGGQFEDCEQGVTVIVDASYDQFEKQYYTSGQVDVCLGESLDPVAVLTPIDDTYSAYL